jgi:DNA-binding NtrC family response regulator
MLGMGGLTLLGETKQPFPDLLFMMVTAHGDDEHRRLAAEQGAAEFVTKPVDFELLETQLRQLPMRMRLIEGCKPRTSNRFPAFA